MHFGPFSENELNQIVPELEKAKVQFELAENNQPQDKTKKNLRFDSGNTDLIILESEKAKVPASLEKFGIMFKQEFTFEEIMKMNAEDKAKEVPKEKMSNTAMNAIGIKLVVGFIVIYGLMTLIRSFKMGW